MNSNSSQDDSSDTTTTASSLPFPPPDGVETVVQQHRVAAAVQEDEDMEPVSSVVVTDGTLTHQGEALPVTPATATPTTTTTTTVITPTTNNNNDYWTALIYAKNGAPFETRTESVQAMRALMGQQTQAGKDEGESTTSATTNTISTGTTNAAQTRMQQQQQTQRPPLSNVHGRGPLMVSDIPPSCRSQGVCVGIDEAGRGSVLGPMVYGAAFWNAALDQDKTKIPPGFNDSKQLTEDARQKLLEQLMTSNDIGWCVRVLHASEISRNMLRPGRSYNLNQMSHDSAMDMIRALLKAGVPLQTCYIDTVGNADMYRRKLEREFPGLEFVVESKADAKYATCSAASVVAKNVRDYMLETWQFSEPFHASNANNISREFGSGYPSDPRCKEWMQQNLRSPIFGWPDIVRFSWGPAKKTLVKDATPVTFEADDEEDDEQMMSVEDIVGRKRQQEQMTLFLKKGNKTLEEPRYPYFERHNLKVVTNIF